MNSRRILFLVGVGLFAPVLVLAQNQASLPSAGLTPESPLYFLDQLVETIQTFFTSNPAAKARLQITFAAERVAEIKVVLETKGVRAKGLAVAQASLVSHLATASTILTEQKAEGKDVSALAKELDEQFEGPKAALAQTFEAQENALEAREDELKEQILAARQAGDTARVESLVRELGEVKAQKELLELKEEEQEEALEREEERLEEELEAKTKAEKAIREAENEKQEIAEEAASEELTVPPATFRQFDRLLGQAKAALAAGNPQEAKRLAREAEQRLDAAEEDIEELEGAKEKAEELKEEQEEKEREAQEEQEEKEEE